MIYFDNDKQIFHLQTPKTSYIIGIRSGVLLEHLYWGSRVDSLEGMEFSRNSSVSFAAINDELSETQGVSTELLPQEYSFYGSCDMRKPAFHAIYGDGSRITKMSYVSHKITAGKPKLCGLPATYTENDSEADTLEILMRDELTGLEIVCRYTAFNEYDAITRSVDIINNGSTPVSLDSVMSINVDFARDGFDMITLPGAHGRERSIERRKVGTGTTKVESRRGSSSHHESPFFALLDPYADEKHGDVYGFSFVYSGNFEAGAEVDTYGATRAFMGINSFDFAWLLNPGESFYAPEVVMVYSNSGLGEMSRNYHKLYKNRLARSNFRGKERPIVVNNWEATYFNFNEEKILDIAKTAKSAGIEMFVLDDGWFGHRDSDNSSLGDWYEDKKKLPNGISGLAKKVNDLGLSFGLWFEPEMISVDSDLYRTHPDWCLHVNNRPRSESRQQLVLDFSRSDVCEYITDSLCKVLKSAPIEYVKWDYNRNMSCIGSALLPPERQAETAHRYMLGLYKVLDDVISAFPDVLFEGCSGGGGRFDAGMMFYFDQYWTSDNMDCVDRMHIQHGTSLVMPSAFMGSHVPAPTHRMGRVSPLESRGFMAMCGQFGYELDMTTMTEEELDVVREQVKVYKSVRETIHNGDMYRLMSPFESDHTAWEYVSEAKDKAVLMYFTVSSKNSYPNVYVKLEGLDPNGLYKLTSSEKIYDKGEIYNGSVLMNRGISLWYGYDCQSMMLVFEKVN